MSTIENSLSSFLVNDFGDRYLYPVNRNAFNKIGSDSVYRSLYGEKLFNEFQLNLIIGTDSGIFPNYIVKCGIPTGSRYLFVELPEILDTLNNNNVFENLPPEISVTTLDFFQDQAKEYQVHNYAFLDAVRVHESVGSSDANLPEYRNLSWNLNLAIDTLMHEILISANNYPFILRQFANLTENQIPFCEVLQNAFPKRTAVILAGGPSLDDALPWIRENHDRLLVIAVSRICRTLHNEGIVPHIIVSVDPTTLSFEISREMLLFADTPEPPLFISSFHVTPLLSGQWPGKHVYSGPLFPWHTPLNVDSLHYNGPTVSNFALSLCQHMGCTTIILIGVDLCYSAEGQTHAAGSNESKVGPDLGQLSTQIETYGGLQAETSQSFAIAIDILKLQAQEITTHGIQIYNCSLNAAKIPAIGYKPLNEFKLVEWDSTPSAVINCRVPDLTTAARITHYRRIKKEIDRAHSKFQKILSLSRDALKCTDGLFGRNGMRRDFHYKIRMDKIERKLDQSLGDFSLLVKQYGIKRFLISLKTTMADEMSDEQLELATREYYETYVAGTESLIDQMETIARRIDARIEETQELPDFEKLAAQWEMDQQFGRVHVWRKHNLGKANQLTDTERAIFERLQQKFNRVMTEERTTHVIHIENRHNLKHLRSKALLLYGRGEITGLEAMAKALSTHPDQEKALPYFHFVNGLLAELRNIPQEAVSHYENLFTTPPNVLTEDALLQFASLAMKFHDLENSLAALECLVGISPTYLPPYGDLLKAVGRFEDAFDAYNRYIGFAPNDVAALVTLGLLCKEAGLIGPAKELFERVAALDPTNNAANTMLNELG